MVMLRKKKRKKENGKRKKYSDPGLKMKQGKKRQRKGG